MPAQYTRPATWDDVKTVVRHLDREGAEYVLAGGYAIAAHGFNRFSEDVDIVVNPSATIQVDDVAIRVLDLPGLLKTKQGLRPKDQMDAAVLAAAVQRMKDEA